MPAGFQTLDLHGMTRAQARVAIEAALRRANASVYRLRIVHGYQHGSALRDMIRTEYAGDGRIKRILAGANEGVTELVLREL